MVNGSFLIAIQSLFVAWRMSKIQNPLGNVCLQIARNIHQENVYIRFDATHLHIYTAAHLFTIWMNVCVSVCCLTFDEMSTPNERSFLN